jgi:heat shock protein HtpX
VESRVEALVKYAGGHDPGPLALPPAAPDGPEDQTQPSTGEVAPVPKGPWSDATDAAGTTANPWANSAGPWGRH